MSPWRWALMVAALALGAYWAWAMWTFDRVMEARRRALMERLRRDEGRE